MMVRAGLFRRHDPSRGLILALVFACTPIEKNWNVHITSGSYIDRIDLYLATAITNTASDMILIFIPIKVVWGLHLPPMQKLPPRRLAGP